MKSNYEAPMAQEISFKLEENVAVDGSAGTGTRPHSMEFGDSIFLENGQIANP